MRKFTALAIGLTAGIAVAAVAAASELMRPSDVATSTEEG